MAHVLGAVVVELPAVVVEVRVLGAWWWPWSVWWWSRSPWPWWSASCLRPWCSALRPARLIGTRGRGVRWPAGRAWWSGLRLVAWWSSCRGHRGGRPQLVDVVAVVGVVVVVGKLPRWAGCGGQGVRTRRVPSWPRLVEVGRGGFRQDDTPRPRAY